MSNQGSGRYYHKSSGELVLDKATANEDNDDQLIEITYEQWMKITGALVSSGMAPVATGLTQLGNGIYALHTSTQAMVSELNSQIGILAPRVVSTFKYIGAVIASFYFLYVVPFFQAMGAAIASFYFLGVVPFFQSIGPAVSPIFKSVGVSIAEGWDALMVSLFETESRPWGETLAPLIEASQIFASACVTGWRVSSTAFVKGWRGFSSACAIGWRAFSSACVIGWRELSTACSNGWTSLSAASVPMIASLIEYIGEELQKESAQSKAMKKYARDSYDSTYEALASLWEDFRNTGIQSKIASTAVGIWFVLFGFMNLLAPEIILASSGYTPRLLNDPAVSAVRKTAVIDVLVGAICMGAAQRDTPVLYEILATINVVIGGSDVLMVVFGLAPPFNMLTALCELLGAAWITWAVKRDQELNRNVPATRAQRIRAGRKARKISPSDGTRKSRSTGKRTDSQSTTASSRSKSGKSRTKSTTHSSSKKRSHGVAPRRSSHKSTKSETTGAKAVRRGSSRSGSKSGRPASKSVTGGGMRSNGLSLW